MARATPPIQDSRAVRVHFINNYPLGPHCGLMQISERALSAVNFSLLRQPFGEFQVENGESWPVLNFTSGINLLKSEMNYMFYGQKSCKHFSWNGGKV